MGGKRENFDRAMAPVKRIEKSAMTLKSGKYLILIELSLGFRIHDSGGVGFSVFLVKG